MTNLVDDIYLEVVSAVISAIILVCFNFVYKYIITKYRLPVFSLQILDSKNHSKNLVLKELKENINYNEYFVLFRDIKNKSKLKGSSSFTLISIIVSISAYIYIIHYFDEYIDFWNRDFWNFVSYGFLMLNSLGLAITASGSIVILIFVAKFYQKSKSATERLRTLSGYILNLLDGIKLYFFVSNLFHLLLIVLLVKNSDIFYSHNLTGSVIVRLIISFFFIISSRYWLSILKKVYIIAVQNEINNLVLTNCPSIRITTHQTEIGGKVKDIFDEKFIVLDDGGYKSITKWEDIRGIRIIEDDGIGYG
ncbi:hypothetical protein MettiDRAFT_2353 [Methanolobus tindarius DSM 2278]|uniref:Uncharacterized protein n=1 Tax=Methanolobus tindarius DSM 2278 TaxID=1090322 RepID=W9DZR5_METTI|nr:hypothetical protein [Methanolobus tindarius]ETA68866.1 hypothetical protein MettiDRAFT_2353 [Methanolobus tindarius DSM 2278]